jgi:hypothetical protein
MNNFRKPMVGVRREMRKGLVIASLAVLLGVVVALLAGGNQHDPRDLRYWFLAGDAKDWSVEAARGEAKAQFFAGVRLIRTNLLTMIDRVPGLSAVPLVGKRFFEKTSYGLDNNIEDQRLMEAHQWIKQSAEQGFAPAIELEKLFVGRIDTTNQRGK